MSETISFGRDGNVIIELRLGKEGKICILFPDKRILISMHTKLYSNKHKLRKPLYTSKVKISIAGYSISIPPYR